MTTNRARIAELLDRFISGRDSSIALANEIETALADEFADDDYIQDTVLMPASYCPGGGDFLYDEKALVDRLKKLRATL